MLRVSRTLLAISLALAGCGVMRAQSSGELTGVVRDSSGAAVPSAQLKLANAAKGTVLAGASNETGAYRFAPLEPGAYTLTATNSGFAETRVTGIVIEVNRVTRADLSLNVATAQEAVTVAATAQLLDFDSSSKGQIITSEQIRNLPLETKNPLALMTLTPGVAAPLGGRSFNRQGSDGTALSANFSINGGVKNAQGGFQEYIVDGISLTNQRDGTVTGLPSADAIQEFRVQSGGMDPEFGRTVGGVVNYSTRGGTNSPHGNLFEYHRDTVTNARQALPATADKPRNIYNQFGGTFSGPVILPKVYNGKNRTFFLFSAESIPWVRNNAQLATVPTVKMRNGDFSELSQKIYDPATSTTAANRTPFPGNIIPASRFNQYGKLIADKFPDPNHAGLGSNIQGPMKVYTPLHNFTGRMDEVLTSNQRLDFKVTWVDAASLQRWPLGINDIQNANNQYPSRNATGNYSYTIRPSLLYSAAFGFTQFHRVLDDTTGNSLGAQYFGYTVSPLPQATNSNVRPAANWDIYRGLGTGSSQDQLSQTYQLNQNLAWVRGKHTLRFGADIRRYIAGGLLTGGPANGTFNFSPLQTSAGTAVTGNSVASALLGLADSFLISQPPELRASKYVFALYAADDIKLTPALTLNLGLRWDAEGPLAEEKNRVGYFDSRAINPAVNLPGVFRYAGIDGAPSSIIAGNYRTFSPRAGLAWALGSSRKTVVRSAFGMYNAPIPSVGYYAAAPGFEPRVQFAKPSATEAALVLRNSYSVPAASGPVGAAAYLGESFTQPLDRSLMVPRSYQWNIGFQRELMRDTVLEVLYTGNRGVHLLNSYNLSLPPFSLVQQAIDAARTSNNPAAASAYLNTAVPNPIAGKVPGVPGGATVTRVQAASLYPQYLGVSSWVNNRDAIYHALQVSAQKRLGIGLTFLLSYTFSKDIDNVSADASGTIGDNVGNIQNPYNLRAERAVGSFDRKHNFSGSVVYALPFGRGKAYLQHGMANYLLGGFQITGIVSAYSGVPLALVQSASNGLVGASRPDILPGAVDASKAVQHRVAANGNVMWLDPRYFVPAIGHYGNAPARMDSLRAAAFSQVDLGLQRDFKLRESLSLRFRAESFNAFNHTNLSTPIQNVSAADFGTINASFDPRVVQVGLELRF